MIFQQFSVDGIMYSHKGLGVQDAATLRMYRIHEFKV